MTGCRAAVLLMPLALSGCGFFEALSEARRDAMAAPVFIVTEGRARTEGVAVWHVGPDGNILPRWDRDFAFAGSGGGAVTDVAPAPDLRHLGVGGYLFVGDAGTGPCQIDDCALRIHDLGTGDVVFETTDNGVRAAATGLCALGVPQTLDAALEAFVAREAARAGVAPEDHPFSGFSVARVVDGTGEAMTFLGWTSLGDAVVRYRREDRFAVRDAEGAGTGFEAEIGLDAPEVAVDVYLRISEQGSGFSPSACLTQAPTLTGNPVARVAPVVAPWAPDGPAGRSGFTVDGQPATLWPLLPADSRPFLYPVGVAGGPVLGPYDHALAPLR